jgi:hypothetical protein
MVAGRLGRAGNLVDKRHRLGEVLAHEALDDLVTAPLPTGQGIGWNHLGQRAGRPLLATWAEAGVALAAELLAGDQDPRPHAAAAR